VTREQLLRGNDVLAAIHIVPGQAVWVTETASRVASTGMEYVPGEGEDETILDVLGELEGLGFTGQFKPCEGGQVECLTCHRLSPADETVFRQLRRLEGASDPDDMLAVVGLACPHCSAQGTAVLGYGPEAAAADTEVLQLLEDARRRQERSETGG
jgi:hypothetical protein